MSVLDLALKYQAVGISVLPIRTDHTKAPLLNEWKHLQDRCATESELETLFRGDCGIAAIGGKVSGNLEIYDFDDAGHFNAWEELVIEHLGESFFKKLLIVRTPRPGFHVHTRCNVVDGSQKLAMKLVDDPSHPRGKKPKVLIETKGEGGYVLLPGCPPACHETGRTYEKLQGSFSLIPQLTEHEREVLMTCARSFNEILREEHKAPEPHRPSGSEKRPGTDFADQCNWLEVLRPHGYKFHSQRGDVSLWTRPGKEHGISASTNYGGSDLFYPFSTNCYPFDNNRGYGKFSAFTLLNFNGDFHAAAKDLARQGYGEPAKAPNRLYIPEQPLEEPKKSAEPKPSDIIEPISLAAEMKELRRTGLEPGISPGWESLRPHWTLRKGELTLCTGIPSHGKSGFINAVMVNLSKSTDWKWGVFSPENLPHRYHIADLMEQYVGRPFNEGYHKRISDEEHEKALAFLQEHFRFIAPPEDEETLERIMRCAETLIETTKIDGLVIDPWNELNHSWTEQRIPETEYISRCLKRVKRVAQRHNIHIVLVAHPKQLLKDKEGKYPIPTPYDISGSANWRNKADCAICVWRDEARPGETRIFIQKIRRRFVGKIGAVDLKYDVVTGKYSEYVYAREPGMEG